MLCAIACAHELRSPIWPRYPADAPEDDESPPPYDSPSASSIASVVSWLARRLASASVVPGREYSCSSRCACAHQRRSEEHTSELQSLRHLVCRLLLRKKTSQASCSPQS